MFLTRTEPKVNRNYNCNMATNMQSIRTITDCQSVNTVADNRQQRVKTTDNRESKELRIVKTVADCQYSCRLLRQLKTVVDFADMIVLVFSKWSVSQPCNAGAMTVGCL